RQGPRRKHRVPNRLGHDGVTCRRRSERSRGEEGHRLAHRPSSRRRRVGRTMVHRHRLPARVLFEVSPLPPLLPADGAGAVSAVCRHDAITRSNVNALALLTRYQANPNLMIALLAAGVVVLMYGVGPIVT